jgi:hypothetical protein
MDQVLHDALTAFMAAKKFQGKGPLSVALVVTEHAKKRGLPLDPERLITENGAGGQVVGLGRGAVQGILARYGVLRVLAKEGGRTSRGSIKKMRAYVAFLNQLKIDQATNLDEIQKFWIDRVHDLFAADPFQISLDSSKSVRSVVEGVIQQAEERQRESTGTHYAGAVMQHLVGAKLDCTLGLGQVAHHSFSTSDEQSGRPGDFVVGDVGIHVTTSPGEAVIARCRDNLSAALRPVIVTLKRRVALAEGLAEDQGVADRIDIFEIEQFIALNLYEFGKFAAAGRRIATADLVKRYNEIIYEVETDPSLRIEFRK